MGRRPPHRPQSARRRKTTKGKSCPGARPCVGGGKVEKATKSITETAVVLGDEDVALAIADLLPDHSFGQVRRLMRKWRKSILKAPIPGRARRLPTKAMLERAKRSVLRFYAREEALGDRSHIVQAFHLASREQTLRFDWRRAHERVRRASFDMKKNIDAWDECLAMSSGDTNALSEIYVCGTKKVTLRALTSLVCHEGLHNLALRTRRGNPYLSEDTEHLAMALLGDPQLIQGDDQGQRESRLRDAQQPEAPEDHREINRMAWSLLAESCPELCRHGTLRELLAAVA